MSDGGAGGGALGRFAAQAVAGGFALHSVELLRAGELVHSAGVPGLGPLAPHRMFSVGKSLTGLAVNLLAHEGLLGLDDPVAAYFPEHCAHPWVAAATVEDVLTMRGPHSATTYKRHDGAWLDSWFAVPPSHPAGSLFTYDTSGSYVLSALVERLTGRTLADVLRERVLDALDVGRDLRFLPGPDGWSQGGSGLICRPRDLLALAGLILDDGAAPADVGATTGPQLLPPGLLQRAHRPLADTTGVPWGPDFVHGYGHQTWIPRGGGFLWFGMAGQIVLGRPDRREVVVVTADTQGVAGGDQKLLDLLQQTLGDDDDDDAATPTTDLTLPAAPHRTEHGRTLAAELRPVAGGLTDGGDAHLVLDVTAESGTLRLRTVAGGETWQLRYACGSELAQVVGPDERAAVVTSGWAAPGLLAVTCWLVDDEPAVVRVFLHLREDGRVVVRTTGTGETLAPTWNAIVTFG